MLSALCTYLCLSEPQGGGELGPLGQGEVLGALEAAVELLQLQGGVDGAGLPHLLLAILLHELLGGLLS